MSRYIDADELKQQVESPYTEYPIMIQIRRAIKEFIDSAPTIDIVRCRECKNAYMTYDGRCKYCEKQKDDDDNYLELYLDGEYYCADGERKEGEE